MLEETGKESAAAAGKVKSWKESAVAAAGKVKPAAGKVKPAAAAAGKMEPVKSVESVFPLL